MTELLLALEQKQAAALKSDFRAFAHDHQLPPERANSGADWTTWLILGGRGAGKTRAGAEWVRSLALADRHPPQPKLRSRVRAPSGTGAR